MDAFHVEFDIDGSAHPELHDTLAALSDPSLRGERLRQLALTGLIWERLRLEPDGTHEPNRGSEAPATVKRLALVAGPPPRRPEAAGLPVLRDVVSEAEMDSRVDSLPLPSPAESTLLSDAPVRSAPTNADGAAPSAVPVIHMTGTRSRLMRMKSRGLFANE